jgi:hypothetical protein
MISLVFTKSDGVNVDYKIDAISDKEDNFAIMSVNDKSTPGVFKPSFQVDYYKIKDFKQYAEDNNFTLTVYNAGGAPEVLVAESYTVTFTVQSNSTGISGAEVTFCNDVKNTDGEGVAVFAGVPLGAYNWEVSAASYISKSGTLDVVDQNVDKLVELVAS